MKKAQIIIPQGTEKFHAIFAQQVKDRAVEVMENIRGQLHLPAGVLDILVTANSNKVRSNGEVLSSVLGSAEDNDTVRIVYSDKRISDGLIRRFFTTNQLLVAVHEESGHQKIGILNSSAGCRASVSPEWGARLIEDVFIDIYLGRLRTASGVLEQYVARYGLGSLFRAKAQFFRKNVHRSWLGSISRTAGYAPLASLNCLEIDDIKKRASAAIEMWMEFEKSFSMIRFPRGGTRTLRMPQTTAGNGFDDLKKVPKIGGQLNVRRIARSAGMLTDGSYSLVVLRRSSSAGKSPATRNLIKSFFGPHARINSFVFFSTTQLNEARKQVSDLLLGRYVCVVHIQLAGGQLQEFQFLSGE